LARCLEKAAASPAENRCERNKRDRDAFKRQLIRRPVMSLIGRLFGSGKAKKAADKSAAAKKEGAQAKPAKSTKPKAKAAKASAPAKKGPASKTASKK
jgi:hypothetical protein